MRSFFRLLCSHEKYTAQINLKINKQGSIAQGFLDPVSKEKIQLKDESDTSARTHSRNKRLKEKEDYYSTKLLQPYLLNEIGTPNIVPEYASMFCLFLWSEKNVKPFSKSLQNESELAQSQIKKYWNVMNEFWAWYKPISLMDKLVFNIFMEAAYGFSVFSYIGNLLDDISNTPLPF